MKFLLKILPCLILVAMCVLPVPALARTTLIDQLNLAPFVPIVLDAMMAVASATYEFFVGNGRGIIYMLIWGFLAITIALYLVKIYVPGNWTGLIGLSGGGDLANGKTDAMTIVYNVMKPCVRGIIATALLLQIRPTLLTEVLVNPFLQFGSLYTHSITETIRETGTETTKFECPESIIEKSWISKSSCEFLIQPVADLSVANNTMIKRGFEFLSRGLFQQLTGMVVPHGALGFLNTITGIILISTFFSSNLFMALLIIQGIFEFGMALVLYPFQVLSYVAKPNDKWLDIWPAFAGITTALKKLVITMVMCAFMLCINIAIIRSLFTWNSSIFVTAAGGFVSTNVPSDTSIGGFGDHSILWLSSILTFYLMFKLFDMTRAQLNSYVGDNSDKLYNDVVNDTKTLISGAKTTGKNIGKAIKAIKWIEGK